MESGRLHYLWQQLAREMPNRSAKAIYQHAHRKLLKDVITPWSEEDKAQLTVLVAQKGKNWSAISKILNKLGTHSLTYLLTHLTTYSLTHSLN
jgi:hypothetical protein